MFKYWYALALALSLHSFTWSMNDTQLESTFENFVSQSCNQQILTKLFHRGAVVSLVTGIGVCVGGIIAQEAHSLPATLIFLTGAVYLLGNADILAYNQNVLQKDSYNAQEIRNLLNSQGIIPITKKALIQNLETLSGRICIDPRNYRALWYSITKK
jgi:hypothetical protein